MAISRTLPSSSAAARGADRHHRSLRGRIARRPLDRRPGRVHADQRHRHALDARRPRAAYWLGEHRGVASLSTMCRPTRSTARWDPTTRHSRNRPRTRPILPYSASKAASDHLVRAYHHTYGLQTYDQQLLEQLWAVSVSGKADSADDRATSLAGKSLPVYGDGRNVRDWLHVEDHCRGIDAVLSAARWVRSTTSAAAQNARTFTWCALCARSSTNSYLEEELRARFPDSAAARGRVERAADALCQGPARPRSALCD